jgi:hypothetical protein
VNIFHVILYLNGVLLATHVKLVQSIRPLIWYQRPFIPSCTLVLKPVLKEFLQ